MADLSQLSLEDLYALRNQAEGKQRFDSIPSVQSVANPNPMLPDIQAAIKQHEAINPAMQGGELRPFGIPTGIKTSPAVDQFLAGAGKATSDLSTGYYQFLSDLGQMPKMFSREDIDKKKRLEAPLMATGPGQFGNFTGNVVDMLPLAAVPGLNTFTGALGSGFGLGLTEPVGTSDSRTGNALASAAFSAGTPALMTAARGIKALAEPAYQGGRDAIVGRTFNRFIGDDPLALQRLLNPQIHVPGSLPTTADVTQNAGLAMLENGAATRVPEAKVALDQRIKANNAARQGALQAIAGDPSQMDFYKASRDATAQDLYAKAFAEAPGDTPYIKGKVTELTKRPAFVQALKDGQELAMNLGIKVDPKSPENTTQILHFTKQALDDHISAASQSGNGNKARALIDTRDKLVSLLESKDFSPSYREARDTYKNMSQPINQMEVGQTLYNKMVPALNDFGGTTRAKAQSYADAVRNGDATAAKALGFPGAKMDQVMSPAQMQTITGVAKDLSRRAATEDMMRGIGSNTAQNLAAQNIMGQIAGPLGLPESWLQAGMGNLLNVPYVGGLLGLGLKLPEGALQRDMAKALLDPSEAAKMLKKAKPKPVSPVLLGAARYLPAARFGLLESIANSGQ